MKWFVVGVAALLVSIVVWLDRPSTASVPGEEVNRHAEEALERLLSTSDADFGTGRRTASSSHEEVQEGNGSFDELVGTVVGPQGEPVAGAVVQVAVESLNGPVALDTRAETDELGRFTLRVHASTDQELVVLARSERFGPGSVRTRERRVDISLPAGLHVHGRVVDQTGLPVAKVAVEVAPWRVVAWIDTDAIDRRSAVTGPDGSFEVEGLASGLMIATASLESYANVRDVRSGDQDRSEPWVLELAPGADLIGRVVTPDREPVAGIVLELDGDEGTRHERSSADGSFRFARVPVGEAILAWEPDEWAAGFTTIDVPTNGVLEVVLEEPAAIRGRVWTSSGGGYSVCAAGAIGEASESFRTSDFSLGGLPAGSYAVTIEPEGGLSRSVGTVRLSAGDIVDLGTISIDRGTTAFGRAEFLDGEPVAGECRLDLFTGERIAWKEVSSMPLGAAGQFEFSGLEPGRYRAIVRPENGIDAESDPRFLVTGVDVDFGLVLCPHSATVRVDLIGVDGEPETNQTLHLSSNRTAHSRRTDATGTCVFESIAPGEARLTVRVSEGYRSVPIEVRGEGSTSVTVDLRDFDRGVTWSGRLLGEEGPLSMCSVRLRAFDYSWMTRDATATEDGSFELTGLMDGPGILDVYVPERQASVRVSVSGAPRPSELSIRLGRVEGVFRGSAGTILPVVVDRLDWLSTGVPALEYEARPYAESATDADGSFEFRALPVGPYRVRVYVPDGRVIEQDVEVRTGTQKLEVDLE